MRRITAIAMLSAAALALAACSGSEDQTTEAGPAATLTTAETTGPETTDEATEEPTGTDTDDVSAGSDDGLFGTPADVGGPYGELRDGVWAVGPAGEVEFRVAGPDTVELVDARANDGWTITDEEVDSDTIEIDFRQGPVEYEIEIEIEGGVLEIEIDQDIDPAESGTFAVGEAATVEIAVDGGRLVLGDVTIADGWNETSRDVEGDEVELDFRRDGSGFVETWEINADLDDGILEIEVDYEIEGTFTQ